MVIRELYIKNFGKFRERHFYLKDGVQVISGENEFGKSTLHAFIRAMLFGLERGRGRAAARDAFTRYEPWDDPGSYAGVMRFTCGGRNFRLERSFARAAQRASLVCEDDGEELSLEHGDLDMLLGGMSAALFDTTVSVGQLQARPGQELYEALENRAANYFETGCGEIDLAAAFRRLKEKQRSVEREVKEQEAAREKEQERVRQECRYLERDMRALQDEYEEKRGRLELLGDPEETGAAQDKGPQAGAAGRKESVSGPGNLIRMGAVGVLAGAAGFLWSLFLENAVHTLPSAPFAGVSAAVAAVGILLLAAGTAAAVKARRRGAGAEDVRPGEKAEQRKTGGNGKSRAEGNDKNQAEARRLQGEMDHIRSAWKEKEIRCANLREQCEECGDSDALRMLRRRQQALALAEETLEKTAAEIGDQTAGILNRRASEIFAAFTDGAYRSLRMDGERHLSVWDGVRNIPAERLSRGTVEQIYLAVRLAAADILLEEPVPVILDDVFAFYDDKRLESALKWLSCQGKQVIIFTCHKREEEIAKRVVYS
ncbi:MAG TPA: AAA family ATPase [Candidatus Mediterraneibacter tabaqchaliae]|uniref:AAA family ATPase n=1 Tax=Candidatus Mediterraneibacter tabaqchaliae TaxID=2838689 RepID=A0A9D2R5C1_9FIRM|nr:AAA family ATPase [Candidatus Mediterraneibacter tabaqchaliae]